MATRIPRPDPADPTSFLPRWEEIERLRKQELPAMKRALVADMIEAGHSYRTIGRVIDRTPSAVRDMLHDPDNSKRNDRRRRAKDRKDEAADTEPTATVTEPTATVTEPTHAASD